VIAG